MAKRAAGGVAATWIRLVLVTLTALLQTPVLFRYIPKGDLGIWYLFFTIATFINLSDFGLPSAFGRAVSYIWGQKGSAAGATNPEQIPEAYRTIPLLDLYSSALLATAFMGIVFCSVSLPLAYLYFFHALASPAMDSAHLITPLALFLLGVMLNFMAAIPNACLSGYGDVGLDNALRTVINIGGFVMVLVLTPIYRNLTILSAIYLGQGLLALLAGHAIVSLRHRFPILSIGKFDSIAIRSMYRESAPIFVSRLGTWLVLESNLLIAGYFLGAARIPDYAVLRQVVAIGTGIITAIPIAVSPHATAAHSSGDPDKVISLYMAALRYSMLINVLWTVGLLLWTPEVMVLWLGGSHFLGYPVLIPIVFASFLELHAATHSFFVWSTGRWPFAPFAIAGGLLNLILASLGCHWLAFEGLSWGTLFAQSVTNYWYPAYYALTHIGVSIRRFYREFIAPITIYSFSLSLAGVAIKQTITCITPLIRISSEPSPFMQGGSLVAGIVLTSVAAIILSWLILFDAGDKSYVRTLVPSFGGRSSKGRA